MSSALLAVAACACILVSARDYAEEVASPVFKNATEMRQMSERVTRKRQKVTAREIAGCLKTILKAPRTRAACARARETTADEAGVAAAVREIESLSANSKP